MIVIGVGNELRHDDGAGPAVIGELRDRRLKGVTLAVSDGEPARLIDLWAEADLAVVVDAVQTTSGEPGRVRELDSINGVHPGTSSSHALGLGAAMRLAEALDRMPGRLRIYSIEGADFGLGPGLSAPVAQAVTEVAQRITTLARDAHRKPTGGPDG
ncbi:hydrogenase maturation protease [Actinoallomurus sp. NPDC050550]|uniref:hydrogenase maturation protease n=1 Tax=Actinoallomurus sp. NPDC050550 TaxID=3154937 RepID=UPI0033FF89E5